VKAQLVDGIKTLTRDSSGVYSFELNYWEVNTMAAMPPWTINGVEQPVDFMLQSGCICNIK
jgi:hypothetical protein